MNKLKIGLVALLVMSAAITAKATKAKAFIGYINLGSSWTTVYVPYDCPYSGYGCRYTDYTGASYQVYQQVGNQYFPLKP
jgi:hypothetical protein